MTNTQEAHERPGMSRRTLLTGAAVGGAALAATVVEASPVGAAFIPTGAPRQPGIAADKAPGVGNTFELVVDQIGTFSGFQAVAGLTNEVNVVEFRDGSSGGEEVTRLIPGSVKFPAVSLSRPVQGDVQLNDWHEFVITGSPQGPKECSLTVLSYEGRPVARYHLENAWPSRIEIGALLAGGAEVLMETVTIVCEHLDRVAV